MLFELRGKPLETVLIEFLAKFIATGVALVYCRPLNHLPLPLGPRDLIFCSITRQQARLLHYGHVDQAGEADAGEFEAIDIGTILLTELQAFLKM